jgi:hypothetical protein
MHARHASARAHEIHTLLDMIDCLPFDEWFLATAVELSLRARLAGLR